MQPAKQISVAATIPARDGCMKDRSGVPGARSPGSGSFHTSCCKSAMDCLEPPIQILVQPNLCAVSFNMGSEFIDRLSEKLLCRLKVPVRGYFSAILPGLADLAIRCLTDLTPAVWLARHS
jgi:hypothetical protein